MEPKEFPLKKPVIFLSYLHFGDISLSFTLWGLKMFLWISLSYVSHTLWGHFSLIYNVGANDILWNIAVMFLSHLHYEDKIYIPLKSQSWFSLTYSVGTEDMKKISIQPLFSLIYIVGPFLLSLHCEDKWYFFKCTCPVSHSLTLGGHLSLTCTVGT